ncbi:MAG: hypothetical protein AAFZ91_05970 [Pseudomonadota bacterium]
MAEPIIILAHPRDLPFARQLHGLLSNVGIRSSVSDVFKMLPWGAQRVPERIRQAKVIVCCWGRHSLIQGRLFQAASFAASSNGENRLVSITCLEDFELPESLPNVEVDNLSRWYFSNGSTEAQLNELRSLLSKFDTILDQGFCVDLFDAFIEKNTIEKSRKYFDLHTELGGVHRTTNASIDDYRKSTWKAAEAHPYIETSTVLQLLKIAIGKCVSDVAADRNSYIWFERLKAIWAAYKLKQPDEVVVQQKSFMSSKNSRVSSLNLLLTAMAHDKKNNWPAIWWPLIAPTSDPMRNDHETAALLSQLQLSAEETSRIDSDTRKWFLHQQQKLNKKKVDAEEVLAGFEEATGSFSDRILKLSEPDWNLLEKLLFGQGKEILAYKRALSRRLLGRHPQRMIDYIGALTNLLRTKRLIFAAPLIIAMGFGVWSYAEEHGKVEMRQIIEADQAREERIVEATMERFAREQAEQEARRPKLQAVDITANPSESLDFLIASKTDETAVAISEDVEVFPLGGGFTVVDGGFEMSPKKTLDLSLIENSSLLLRTTNGGFSELWDINARQMISRCSIEAPERIQRLLKRDRADLYVHAGFGVREADLVKIYTGEEAHGQVVYQYELASGECVPLNGAIDGSRAPREIFGTQNLIGFFDEFQVPSLLDRGSGELLDLPTDIDFRELEDWAVSRSEKIAVAKFFAGNFTVFKREEGSQIFESHWSFLEALELTALDISSDGKWVAAGTNQGDLYLWSVALGPERSFQFSLLNKGAGVGHFRNRESVSQPSCCIVKDIEFLGEPTQNQYELLTLADDNKVVRWRATLPDQLAEDPSSIEETEVGNTL